MTGQRGSGRPLLVRVAGSYGPPDPAIEDTVVWGTVAPHLLRALAFFVAPSVLVLAYLVLSYLRSISTPDPVNNLIIGGVGFFAVLLYIGGLVALFVPTKEPISEYARLVRDAGAAAGAVVEQLQRGAAAREVPATVWPSSVAGVPVLMLAQRSERVMVLVQPYGRDLYVGWTMWRQRSAATLFGHFLRDTYGRAVPHPWFASELRAAAARALRESVQSLLGDAVAAVADATSPPGAGGAGPAEPAVYPDWSADHVAGPVHPPGTGALPRAVPPTDTAARWPRRPGHSGENR